MHQQFILPIYLSSVAHVDSWYELFTIKRVRCDGHIYSTAMDCHMSPNAISPKQTIDKIGFLIFCRHIVIVCWWIGKFGSFFFFFVISHGAQSSICVYFDTISERCCVGPSRSSEFLGDVSNLDLVKKFTLNSHNKKMLSYNAYANWMPLVLFDMIFRNDESDRTADFLHRMYYILYILYAFIQHCKQFIFCQRCRKTALPFFNCRRIHFHSLHSRFKFWPECRRPFVHYVRYLMHL